MSKESKTGNLPYIPLYIGDWEKDTNMLSLEAEGGWMKIIFKMWSNGKTGIYKISTKALQNLWKKSNAETLEIIQELKDGKVCDIEQVENDFVFKNRRMIKQHYISQVRSNAAQKRYK